MRIEIELELSDELVGELTNYSRLDNDEAVYYLEEDTFIIESMFKLHRFKINDLDSNLQKIILNAKPFYNIIQKKIKIQPLVNLN